MLCSVWPGPRTQTPHCPNWRAMTVLRQRHSQDTHVHPRRDADPKPVTAFVDWAAQMHNAGVSHTPQIVEGAQRTFSKTAQAVGRLLKAEESRFRVSFRLYHGWHKGWQRTDGFVAARQAVDSIDFARLSEPHVDFSPVVAYGHTLLDALPERRTKSIHLPNTLRDQGRDEAHREDGRHRHCRGSPRMGRSVSLGVGVGIGGR